MKIPNNLVRRFNSYMTHLGRARAREVLLRSSDRMLKDAGFSRELLESGVKAWPWHTPDAPLAPLRFNEFDDLATNVAAIRELETYSDKDLHDLGISRGSIPQVVMHGREGIDNAHERNAA